MTGGGSLAGCSGSGGFSESPPQHPLPPAQDKFTSLVEPKVLFQPKKLLLFSKENRLRWRNAFHRKLLLPVKNFISPLKYQMSTFCFASKCF